MTEAKKDLMLGTQLDRMRVALKDRLMVGYLDVTTARKLEKLEALRLVKLKVGSLAL